MTNVTVRHRPLGLQKRQRRSSYRGAHFADVGELTHVNASLHNER